MKKLTQFAEDHPLVFTFVALLLLIGLMGGAAALSAGLLEYQITAVEPQVIGQLVATIGFLLLLWGLGWLAPAGITRLGNRRIWLITLLILVYTGMSALLAFFGALRVDLSLNPGTGPVLLHTMLAGVMEEILFRGLILYALVSRWGGTRRGTVSAVLVSAFLFGVLHFFNLLGGPADITALQVTEAAASGILYGALVLTAGSVWPAVILHSLINLLVNIAVLNEPGFSVTPAQYLTLVLLDIPLVLYGFYLLTRTNLRSALHPEMKEADPLPARL
jgi:membrane protease YdiL (CAAX protease family)